MSIKEMLRQEIEETKVRFHQLLDLERLFHYIKAHFDSHEAQIRKIVNTFQAEH